MIHDTLKEKCAVAGVWNKDNDVARTTYFTLFAQQHRGQEHTGIASYDAGTIHLYKAAGLVSQVYTEEIIEGLTGTVAIGHNRYSTSKGIGVEHAQPVQFTPSFALAHNGNLPSVKNLEAFVTENGFDASDHSDSELMALTVEVFRKQGMSVRDALVKAVPMFVGAFSAVAMGDGALFAFRDQFGIRPLSIGKQSTGGYVIASETCALDTVGADFVRDVAPGEIVVINDKGIESVIFAEAKPMIDMFEYVYFARHDSTINGRLVYEARRDAGRELGREYTPPIDVVVPVPETSIPAAIGYAQERGIPFELALHKNRYIHRTFILPKQEDREKAVRMKLTVLRPLVEGKRVALIDDSVVRGTTSKQIVDMMFQAGAAEVHYVVASPPVRFPDFYGIDTPDQDHLIAAQKTIEEIREYIGVTGLHYLSIDGLVRAIGLPRENLCSSCFTGEYPIDLGEKAENIRYDLPDFIKNTP
jgi:amidophosphoribosyltransferase